MNSLTILSHILNDVSSSLGTDLSRDLTTVNSRFENEGQSFLSITLPSFGSWFVKSLESERAEIDILSSFKSKRLKGKRTVLPCFLHGLTSQVFCPRSGNIRSDPSIPAISAIWQICNLLKKEKKLCSPERVASALQSYVETDLEVGRFSLPVRDCVFDSVAHTIISEIDSRFHLTNCKHGPGATADGYKMNQKFTVMEWYKRWNRCFSWEQIYGFSTIDPHNYSTAYATELPVKVIPVPKTAKTPRIISIEPTAMQFAQQMVSSSLVSAMSKCSFSSQVDISDQSVNARLAKDSSLTKEYGTLDLSEASDRLSAKLVRNIFRHSPTIKSYLFATRSSKACVSGETLILSKFASMGSATTFPVQTICFYIIALSAVVKERMSKSPGSLASIIRLSKKVVYVYGDDIIVPSDSFRRVVDTFSLYGLKVNTKKSFVNGFFRESCGMDAYKGKRITPVYVRSHAPTTINDASEFVSFVSLGRQLEKAGYWSTSKLIREYIDSIYSLPVTSDTSSALGWFSHEQRVTVDKWSKTLYRPMVRSLVAKASRKADAISDYAALLKTQIYSEQSLGHSLTAADHLEYSTIPHSIVLRRRMVCA